MPKFGYAVFAGLFSGLLLAFERFVINARLYKWKVDPDYLVIIKPVDEWPIFFLGTLIFMFFGFLYGAVLGFSWGILSIGANDKFSLFKLFLFSVIAMAVIGGLHDYYIFTYNNIISENIRWLAFLPELFVIFSSVIFGLWLRNKSKKMNNIPSQLEIN